MSSPLWAQVLALARGRISDAKTIAEQRRAPDRVQRIIKALAGSTTLQAWSALPDYQLLGTGLIESLRSIGFFDRMLAEGMRRVPLRTRAVGVTSAMSGSTPAEGAVKQVSELQLSGANLEPIKSATIVAVTRELLELTGSAGQAFLSRELRAGTIAATDLGFIAILAAAATSIVSSGEDIESIFTDLRAMNTAVDVSAMSALFLVLNPQRAKLMALMEGTAGRAFPDLTYRGGQVAGIPAVVSDGIADDQALLVDAAQVAGESDAITLDSSEEAMLDMAGGGSPNFDLFGRGCVAIRSERWWGAQVLGSNAAALLTSVSWGEGSTP